MTLSGKRLMIYMGSKNRIAKHIVPIIQSYIDSSGCTKYLEPMVGGGNVIDKIKCETKTGSDIDNYVIAALNGLQKGLKPPKEVTREFYYEVKNNKDKFTDFIVGYIGYELSFGGKWFGGYRKLDYQKHSGDIYSYKSCVNQAARLKDIKFQCCSFLDYLALKGYVIYCDPPYRGTTKYKTDEFPYESFYDWCRDMSKDNIVLVSEYSMPADFRRIWEKEIKITFDSNRESDSREIRTEKLFLA